MRLPRHIANETLATSEPAGDIYAALHGYIPLATDDDIQDWINTYASEIWSSQEEMVRIITGDASVRCSVSVTASSSSNPKLSASSLDHPCQCREIRWGLDL